MLNIKNISNKIVIIVVIIMITLISIYGYSIKVANDSHSPVTLNINEYMIHNKNTIRDSNWDTPDWIELFNYGHESISLGDIYISDDSEYPEKYLLPNRDIKAGEYLLIYASGKENQSKEIHTPFKLSEKDKCIVLSDKQGQVIDMCKVDSLPQDVSAGIDDGEWKYYAIPTPNMINDTPSSTTLDINPIVLGLQNIIINEYMSDNQYTLKDTRGISIDWIELYNPSDESVWLGNLYLSDNASKLNKFLLPDYHIGSKEYLLIYADSEGISTDKHFYATFSLGGDDQQIILSNNNGSIIDVCNIDQLPCDISAGFSNDVWGYFRSPTPGTSNTTISSTAYDIEPKKVIESSIYINEFMTNNEYSIIDSYGDSSDWIELYNPNDFDISLDGYYLSDDEDESQKWAFPQKATIKALDYLLIFASNRDLFSEYNNELHTNFSLSEYDTRLILYQANMTIVDSVELMRMPGNVSRGRLENGEYGYFMLPTPNSKNSSNYVEKIDNNSNIILGDIYISEVSSGEVRLSRTATNDLSQFIELYNKSNITINLRGYSIDDNNSTWVFPDISIGPKNYLVLSSKDAISENIPSINAGVSISSSGEELTLKNSDGIIIDHYKSGYLTGEYSSGRNSDTDSQRYFYIQKTPGSMNPSSTIKLYTQKPIFSHAGGMVKEKSFLLEITKTTNSILRYTLDGSNPSETSKVYNEPLLINEDTIVRAKAYDENKLPSATTSTTYIFSREHSLPIICLSTSPDNMFSNASGIYANGSGYDNSEKPYFNANFWFDWERPISFEFYDINNELGLSFDAGIQIAGQYSRAENQKSLVIHLRDEYGINEIYYPFFENNEVDEFKHILLRTSGQDVSHTKIRDYYFHQSIKDYTQLDIMDGRPAVVYINGEYWGLYNIREKINKDYLASHHGVETDNVTIIKGNSTVMEGNSNDWNDLRNFCTNNDFSDGTLYKQLEKRIDVDAFIDYVIVETFFCNQDNGNIQYWRDNSQGGMWRPILFDLDSSINSYNYTSNHLRIYFRQGEFSNIFYALKQNSEFCNKFVARYAYFINEVFTKDNISHDINGILNDISPEMIYHTNRWKDPYSVEVWEENISLLKSWVIDRRFYITGHLLNMFNVESDKAEELFPWY